MRVERCVKPQLLLLCASPGIHGYEHGASWIQFKHCILEKEFHNLAPNGTLYGQNLLRDHRQHFQLYAIELIEAGPGSRLCKSL